MIKRLQSVTSKSLFFCLLANFDPWEDFTEKGPLKTMKDAAKDFGKF